MKQISIVKRSDVGHGTALHYALDWSYGRNALCGQTMRATAKEWETTYKRACGTCVRIMASMVEKAHAEALKMITFTAGDVVEYQGSGDDDPNTVGVVLAVDGQKVTVQWDGGDIADMYVGRLVHFTRAIEAAHAEALEHAEVIEYELHTYRSLLAYGGTPRVSMENIDAFREQAAFLPVPPGADEETKRFYALVKKRGANAIVRPCLPLVVEAAHAEALEIAKDRLDIPDFDEEAVYAQAIGTNAGR